VRAATSDRRKNRPRLRGSYCEDSSESGRDCQRDLRASAGCPCQALPNLSLREFAITFLFLSFSIPHLFFSLASGERLSRGGFASYYVLRIYPDTRCCCCCCCCSRMVCRVGILPWREIPAAAFLPGRLPYCAAASTAASTSEDDAEFHHSIRNSAGNKRDIRRSLPGDRVDTVILSSLPWSETPGA